jgi:galactose mutarotase-like enzyme
MSPATYRHFGCRITDDLVYKGQRALFIENDILRIGILLDKGADIFSFIHKPTDTDFLWVSPIGLLDPRRANPTSAAASGAFLDTYHGGWQEIFPGGGPANYRGAELGLHGEVDQLGWDYAILKDTPEEISVLLSVQCLRTPFHLERKMTLKLGIPSLFVEEQLTNLSNEEQCFMWGQHPAFGEPFLQNGTRIILPPCKGEVHAPSFAASSIFSPGTEFEWPNLPDVTGKRVDLSICPGRDGGFADLVYLKDLEEGWFKVINPDGSLGIQFSWDLNVFPYLWFWMVFGKAPGYPWWNQVHVIALEPWSSIPNNLDQAIQRKTHSVLKGGGTQTLAFNVTVFQDVEKMNL